MKSRPEIFAISIILFVPFAYATFSIPDVCAVPPDPGYTGSSTCAARTTNPETGTEMQTCCWKEDWKMMCQTCAVAPGSNTLACSDAKQVNMKLPEGIRPEQDGGVQDEPSTPPKLGGQLRPETGGLIEDRIISGSNASNDTMP